MRLFFKRKDGGSESRVTGYWLIEWKYLFSIVLLKFEDGTRDAYHSHAFNSISWLLSGCLYEVELNGRDHLHTPSLLFPIITRRTTFHKVRSFDTSWVLSFRGPWNSTWTEYSADGEVELTHGRKKTHE